MNPAGLDQMLIPVIVFRDILARMHLQANCYAPDVIVHEVDTQIFIYVNWMTILLKENHRIPSLEHKTKKTYSSAKSGNRFEKPARANGGSDDPVTTIPIFFALNANFKQSYLGLARMGKGKPFSGP